ncbi:hypothetical protein [Rhodoferax sp.]|uniref:hypothetical protein n=1 Tax=Rhodoferax sp. TaxID=50421 RepID=UPI00262B0945|nr:hypothetical protein [Rhodoferax sp.]
MAQLPKRDLTVELRQVEEVASTGYTVSTKSNVPVLSPQSVQVRNGEKASLSIGKTMTMQWVQSVQAQNASLAASGVAVSSNSGGVKHAITTMKSGQSIKVHPSWPGAKKMVTVEVEVQTNTVDARNGSELPNQSNSEVITTVSAPLGQWVTIASTGTAQNQQPGVYSSSAVSDAKRLLQIRVLAP